MQVFWGIVVSNALMVAVLAAGVALLGRIWKNPVGLHLLWILVLLKLVTPPILTVAVPLPAAQPAPALTERAASPGVMPEPRIDIFASSNGSDAVDDHPQSVSEEPPIAGAAALASDVVPSPSPHRETSWLTIVAWCWGLGVALLALAHAFRIVRFLRLLRAAQPPAPFVLKMAEGIAERLGLRRIPEIAMLPVRLSPMVWSLGGRPRVLLPAELFDRLDADARQGILAHELAHVRRRDHWIRLLELAMTTLFWWHPAVWWARRQLQELEEQCCDGIVLGMAPQAARTYATALLDTLDFLSERSVVAPMGATAARLSVSLARRISMFQTHSPVLRLTVGRLGLLAAVAVLPMAIAFAAQPPKSDLKVRPDDQKAVNAPAVERRAVNKRVKDFPETDDLSTPESAQAAWNRASARGDYLALLELSWTKWGPDETEKMQQHRKNNLKDVEIISDAQLNAEIVEVATYREDCAMVISKGKLSEGVGRDPYSSRRFGRINGLWKNLGENRLPSLEAAREDFDRNKEGLWQYFATTRDKVKSGKSTAVESQSRQKRSAPIAPGEPYGISVEKADLMGRVEWAFMGGAQDITARKSIEWGDVEKDKDGNRTIRYKFYATIWDKDVMICNNVFTFDAKGNILDMADVEGFPQKKVTKPVDVSTQAGMKELVEDFFSKNFRDVTSRETIEWGDVTKAENGNSSIRYKYRATYWYTETKIVNQVFTFDSKGLFVSVKDVEGYPLAADGKAAGPARVYEVHKKVADFPDREDLSTPEAAYASIERAYAAEGDAAWPRLSAPKLAEHMPHPEKAAIPKESAERLLATEILEVHVWGENRAVVLARQTSFQKSGSYIDLRWLTRVDGRWLNFGNDVRDTIEQAHQKVD